MTSDERIDGLERRLAVLEALVRDLARQPPPRVTAAPSVPPPTSSAPRATPAAPAQPRRRPLIDPEEWIGQRGLLAVGVVAMILAAGYLLKLSFDRGWISPLLRCVGGVLAGGVVAAIGWRLHPRYRTYGAALVGCGAAIVYLAVWAASRLFEIVPVMPGIAALALVSLALAALAWRLDVEALGATAALGAFFAPVLLGRETAEADLLLVYLACMAAALGTVVALRRWRLNAFVIAASFFGLGGLAAGDATPLGVVAYASLGGAAGLLLGLGAGWRELRFLAFSGGWAMLAVAADELAGSPAVFAGGLLLAAAVWVHALAHPPRWRSPDGESLYFLSTPLLLGWALWIVAPDWFDARAGLVPVLIALPYLAAGYVRIRPAFAAVGVAALTLAVVLRWEGLEAPLALLGLAVTLAVLDRPLGRSDGNFYALALLAGALLHLSDVDLRARPAGDAAFVGAWPLVLWAAVAATVLLAAKLWRYAGDAALDRTMRGGLWTTAGITLFLGVTGELRRAFGGAAGGVDYASLGGELSVSAWWLAFAAALVIVGFARSIKPVRVAGLVVAALAVGKVMLADLASLDALYRVASVFILGLVSLSLAYLYHRHARRDLAGGPDAAPDAALP